MNIQALLIAGGWMRMPRGVPGGEARTSDTSGSFLRELRVMHHRLLRGSFLRELRVMHHRLLTGSCFRELRVMHHRFLRGSCITDFSPTPSPLTPNTHTHLRWIMVSTCLLPTPILLAYTTQTQEEADPENINWWKGRLCEMLCQVL